MSKLALFGAKPEVSGVIEPYMSIGDDEIAAVSEVMQSGKLSGFYGSWGDEFYGGEKIRKLEQEWKNKFNVKYAISVNSNTSGLIAAIGACGISGGDEVIVPPYTMSATAMAPLFYGGIPVFADIENETYCIDIDDVRKKITDKTKAIIAVNLFGHPARLSELKELADEKGLYLIEDNAQAPFAMENNIYTGTIGHIGVFSLNYHKHLHSGEGGVCVSNDELLATKISLIRNHGENVVNEIHIDDIENLVGMNLRMTELSAAVAIEQLKRSDNLIQSRRDLAYKLTDAIKDIDGLHVPVERNNCTHVYYVWASQYDAEKLGVSRENFVKALSAEGVPLGSGYVKPLYELPLFKNKKAFGNNGYPFNLTKRVYKTGVCPVTEDMHRNKLITFETCTLDPSEKQISQISNAFHKVYENINELRN